MFKPGEKLYYNKKVIKIQKKEKWSILNKFLKEMLNNNCLKTKKPAKIDWMKMNIWHKTGKYIK